MWLQECVNCWFQISLETVLAGCGHLDANEYILLDGRACLQLMVPSVVLILRLTTAAATWQVNLPDNKGVEGVEGGASEDQGKWQGKW